MNKLKSMFKKDSTSSETTSSSAAPQSQSQTQYASSSPQSQSQPQYSSTGASQQPQQPSADQKQGVLLTTNYGDITIFLFSDMTPKTCKNFAGLADAGKYDGVVFHRIIPGFMIQGGDPTGTGRGGESIFGGKFEDEIVSSLTHTNAGILSMANSGPGTNGSQFFITLAPTPHLDGKHTIFGKVAAGMDVVEQIGNAETDRGDKPLQPIKIIKAQSFIV